MRRRLRDALFWARVFMATIRERALGITCCHCGDTERLPAPVGWQFSTCYDGEARWKCGGCDVETREVG